MATTEVHGPTPITPPLDAPRPRRTRRNAPLQAAAPAAPPADDDELGEEETADLAPTDFWELLSSFHPDEWQQNLIIYTYRTAPKIDRRGNGQGLYIQKYAEAINEERLKLDHGSGGYRIDLLRLNLATRRTQRISRAYTTICDLNFPPRVPDGEWIEAPENEMWKWAAPSVRSAQATMMNPPAAPAADPNKVFDTVLAGVERLAGRGRGDRSEEHTSELQSL